MTDLSKLSYSRYLEAKSTVDNRAVNQQVSEAFGQGLNSKPKSKPLRILDLGVGTGNTLFRLIDKISHVHLQYYAIDISPQHINELRNNLTRWALAKGYDVKEEDCIVIQGDHKRYEYYLFTADLVDYLHVAEEGVYDAVIAQAVLDLFDHQKLLALIVQVLARGGYMYFPITFDGTTTFLPDYDGGTDALVERIYHNSMGRDGEMARCHTGRHLVSSLLTMGIVLEAIGSSDWVVMPDRSAAYKYDEKYFLNTILSCVEDELKKSDAIEPTRAEKWLTCRRNQLEKGQLIYITHQLDILASK